MVGLLPHQLVGTGGNAQRTLVACSPSTRSVQAQLVEVGLAWRHEVCAQVFEEAAVDLGRAPAAFSSSKKGARRGGRVGFPQFQKKGRGPESFRLRNRVSPTGRHSVRVGAHGPRSVTLPVIGSVALREGHAPPAAGLLRPRADGTTRAGSVSPRCRFGGGRIVVTLTCELADLHPAMRHHLDADASRSFVGVDRGLEDLVVVAGSDRAEWERIAAPRHLVSAAPALARANRALSRKVPESANAAKARFVWPASMGGLPTDAMTSPIGSRPRSPRPTAPSASRTWR